MLYIVTRYAEFCLCENYQIYQTFYDRQQAVSRCAQDGATLATITSSEVKSYYISNELSQSSRSGHASVTGTTRSNFDNVVQK